MRFASLETNFMFSARYLVLFSPTPSKINFASLCDSSLLIMSAKDNKSDVFSSFKKARGEFLARSHTISFLQTKGLGFVLMQMCACQKEHMREVIDYVFLGSLHGYPWRSY